MENKPTFLNSIAIPALAAAITGLLAGLLVQVLGGSGLVIGLGVALAAWIFRPGALPSMPVIQLPQVNDKTVKIHLVGDDGHQGDLIQFGTDVDRLRQFAAGLAAGSRLDTRRWTGRGALFSQSEFAQLRAELIARGLARWTSDRDPRGGCVLTARGLATMRGLAALPQTTPPAPENKKQEYTKQTHTNTQYGLTILGGKQK